MYLSTFWSHRASTCQQGSSLHQGHSAVPPGRGSSSGHLKERKQTECSVINRFIEITAPAGKGCACQYQWRYCWVETKPKNKASGCKMEQKTDKNLSIWWYCQARRVLWEQSTGAQPLRSAWPEPAGASTDDLCFAAETEFREFPHKLSTAQKQPAMYHTTCLIQQSSKWL